MSQLRTDSPLSRRIVLSFLQFLSSVQPAPGVDLEGLEVARECLAAVFNIDASSVDSQTNIDSLIDIFHSREASGQRQSNSNVSQGRLNPEAPGTSSSPNAGEHRTGDPHALGVSKDELFGQFFGALENMRYFKSLPDGNDDQAQLDRASQAFHSALEDMQKSGCETFNLKNLADTLKSQGNKAMQSKLYTESIDLYTFAIALSQDNAVYYCNRAAAYTQIQKYAEAIEDCHKALQIDPNYSKAYSRLGFAYFAQGKYKDAIEKGFIRALHLDPQNVSVRENIRVAEQKLIDEHLRAGHAQGSSSASHHPEGDYSVFTRGLSPDIINMLMNTGTNVPQGPHFPGGPGVDINVDAPTEPGIRLGGNVNVNFGEQMPEEISGALRSMMHMFPGATPPRNGEDDINRGPNPNPNPNPR